jgi:anhydro-N-acetylmuramic acid kinase
LTEPPTASAIPRGLFLGLISGTSMDGVDAVLVEIDGDAITTRAASTVPYPADLRRRLAQAIAPGCVLSLHDLATLHVETGCAFAAAAHELLGGAGVQPAAVTAIGSHGQTLRHHPYPPHPYSLQIGDAATIAARCGITTVADFRAMDIAYGGEGAPLVPAFHEWRFRDATEDRVVLNLGGIANVSVLPAYRERPIHGFDTGPGNCLMDEWASEHLGSTFDQDGAWARGGRPSAALLASLLADDYFGRPPPKSTGREVFNRTLLAAHLGKTGSGALPPADVQATLAEFTVESVAQAIERFADCRPARVIVCGGGALNAYLMERLAARLPSTRIGTTAEHGLAPDMIEATTFAWLACMRLHLRPVRMTTAAAPRALVLGAVYQPTAGLSS